MGIISDSVTGIQVKSRIRRFRQERKDLLDDGGRVRDINRAVDEAIADVNSYLGTTGGAQITAKLAEYREADQASDGLLSSARDCIDREIAYWDRRLEEADAKHGGGGSSFGGGGSGSFGGGSGGGGSR